MFQARAELTIEGAGSVVPGWLVPTARPPWLEGATPALPASPTGRWSEPGVASCLRGASGVNLQQGYFFPGSERTTDSARFSRSLDMAADVTHFGFWSFFYKGDNNNNNKRGTCLASPH